MNFAIVLPPPILLGETRSVIKRFARVEGSLLRIGADSGIGHLYCQNLYEHWTGPFALSI